MEAVVKNWKEVAEEIEFMEMVLRGLAPSQYCNSVSTFSTTATDDQDSDTSSETSNESAQSLNGEKVEETSRKGANCAESGGKVVHQLHEGEIIVHYEVENIKEAVIKEEREDVEAMNEVEIEPVGMINFQRRRMVRPNCNSNITTLSTNTAATTEYDSDASSDDSLNDEKVNGKSTKCHFSPENGEEAAEVYLETLYKKQESHGFLCPNCRSSISKVLIIGERYLGPTPNFSLPKPDELIRCTFCFSFLILAGNWLVTRFAPRNQVGQDTLLTAHPGFNSAPVDIVVHQPHGEKIFYSGVKYSGVQESAVKNYEHKDNIENDDLDSFSPSSHKIDLDQNGSYSEKGHTSEHGIVDLEIKNAEEATEIILENLYQKQESHEFYCPCCKTCITKVLIIHQRCYFGRPDKEELRCTSAFSFLIPAGNWLFTSSSPNNQTGQVPITVTPHCKSNPSNSENITRLEEQFGSACAGISMETVYG